MPEEFRTKPRTGLLNCLFEAGLERHHSSVRELLLDRKETWTPWLKEDSVISALHGESVPDHLRLLVPISLGFVLWNDKLKELDQTRQSSV